ncbi:hypothetical protein B0T21DRAFT_424849 [Apiosordaria backusii]|uniref:Uncharacterized protein n=1 Tax=Apiosordaria backusii TaxID=314023 RepID=A0AA40AN48_9PEZI|nr:hypothetical protein B0T21DRAFT_424849 [Apiosordaria backusii]
MGNSRLRKAETAAQSKIRKCFDTGPERFGAGKGGVGVEFGRAMGELGRWDAGGPGQTSRDKEPAALCGSLRQGTVRYNSTASKVPLRCRLTGWLNMQNTGPPSSPRRTIVLAAHVLFGRVELPLGMGPGTGRTGEGVFPLTLSASTASPGEACEGQAPEAGVTITGPSTTPFRDAIRLQGKSVPTGSPPSTPPRCAYLWESAVLFRR